MIIDNTMKVNQMTGDKQYKFLIVKPPPPKKSET